MKSESANPPAGDGRPQRPAQDRPWFSTRAVFVLAMGLALGFALATDRVWEDFYITYKSSKNLVAGHGLVFHPGERVHTFTSPLGVLLPALCHVLTFNHSDKAALWLFRLLSSAAFAGGAALMYATARRLRWHRAAAGLLALWLVTDAKSVDFSINGMETGLLVLCVAWILWVMFAAPPRRQWLHLGLAWGGLMWTRPDGVIYIGALSLAGLLFPDDGRKRVEWIKSCLLAGLVCTAVYLPWFLTAWWYYGTPIPHTIVAKGNAVGPKTLWGALQTWLLLPVSTFKGLGSLDGLFMPSGFFFGGWPAPLLAVTRAVAGLSALVWLIPRVRRETRMVSFAVACLLAYLGYYPGAVAAGWYLPGPAWMSLFVLGGVAAQLLPAARRFTHRAVLAAGLLWLGLGGWFLIEVTRLSKVEQVFVDDGNRRQIGLWLKENAKPGDSMFMECLGYLGYFSELKTFDYPGMSSPEVVAASKKVGVYWNTIIEELKPTWLVIRPTEAAMLAEASPGLLGGDYREVRVFDVTPTVGRFNVRGQGLLAYDSVFIVFHRRTP